MMAIVVTPHEQYLELAKAIGVPDLYFKREDLHPYGSHKGRSIPEMIDYYNRNDKRHFVISSSGNAALAAANHIKILNAEVTSKYHLEIFLGNNIEPSKFTRLSALTDESITITKTDRPLQELKKAMDRGLTSLRQSTDDSALIGYKSLASELIEIGDVGAVFIGTSSGTTAQALAQHFIENKLPIQVHIVQTSSCHPIVDAFGNFGAMNERSLADAIVDTVAFRKNTLVPLVRETSGSGWLATNNDILLAQTLVKKHTNLDISPNSGLSVAGVMQSVKTKHKISSPIVCLIGGS